MPDKTCKGCGKTYPATTEYFVPQKGGKYGVSSRCRACRSTINSQWHRENSDYNKEYRAKHRTEFNTRRAAWRKRQPKSPHAIKLAELAELRAQGKQRCTGCKRILDATLENFGRDANRPSGLFNYCRQCRRDLHAQKKKNKEQGVK